MDRDRFLLLFEHLKTYLLTKKSREMFVFLFFLVVSATFWLLQTLQEDYEMELRIPFTLENVPEDVVVTSDLPSAITVTVKDKGTLLLKYFTNSSERFVNVDFETHDRGNSYEHVVLSHSEVQKMVLSCLQPSTRIVNIRPDTIDYYISRGVQKRVPVQFRGRVEVDPLCYLADLKVEPDSVVVWGNGALLDSLQAIPTAVTNLLELAENKEIRVPLSVKRGTKVQPMEVTVRAEVDVYTEKQVHVPIVGTNFPGGYSLRTFPSSATISFRVGARNYKKVTADNFVLTATYEELKDLTDSVFTLRLRSVPEMVSQVKIEPEKVQYLIEQSDIE